MEHNRNNLAPETATDEPASFYDTRPDFAEPPLLSDSLDDTLAETFPPGGRKPRHDGWTPQAVAGFLHDLAAHGVVEHAARAVGLSAASAYAFRNRRQGRAFAKMWDAVLVHRARARIASELQARAVAGCVSIRKRDGVVVGEYHYYDNRLAMALLTRLDRLAEREAPAEAHLRTLSEDLDDYLDCLAEGGDADAFVESRTPDADEADGSWSELGDGLAEPVESEEFSGAEVWQDDDEAWWTEFPPPAGFDGVEFGTPGAPDYRRALTAAERAVIDADIADELAEDIARKADYRDRYFGFAPDMADAKTSQPDLPATGKARARAPSGSYDTNCLPEEDRETVKGPEE